MGACASDKANLDAYTITMAHEEALVLTKEWDPRTLTKILFSFMSSFRKPLGRENERSTASDLE